VELRGSPIYYYLACGFGRRHMVRLSAAWIEWQHLKGMFQLYPAPAVALIRRDMGPGTVGSKPVHGHSEPDEPRTHDRPMPAVVRPVILTGAWAFWFGRPLVDNGGSEVPAVLADILLRHHHPYTQP